MAGNQELSVVAKPGELFGAVAALALHLGGDLELAPKDETESEVDLAIRLLGELAPMAEQLEAELGQLKRSLAAQKGAATKARAAVEATKPRKPRKFGPVADQLPAHELLELIDAAENVELAFAEGFTEIRGLAPRMVEGGSSAWALAPGGRLRLNVPELVILGPGAAPAFVLGGYALLLDGEQVAWTARDPVTIAPGSRFEFRDDVFFG
jgi:hypothetical protein